MQINKHGLEQADLARRRFGKLLPIGYSFEEIMELKSAPTDSAHLTGAKRQFERQPIDIFGEMTEALKKSSREWTTASARLLCSGRVASTRHN